MAYRVIEFKSPKPKPAAFCFDSSAPPIRVRILFLSGFGSWKKVAEKDGLTVPKRAYELNAIFACVLANERYLAQRIRI